MKIVTVNGCFDLLHGGHLDLLKFARSQGDKLIVLLNSDSSIKTLKGKNRPIFSQSDREQMLLALKYVDEVIIFNEDNPIKWLQTLHPDIHVKSKDADKEKVKKEEVVISRYGGKIVWFKPKRNISTTQIIKRINKLTD
jgi:rfaE bifunctional protein nucleotidyltransferase chain/domain